MNVAIDMRSWWILWYLASRLYKSDGLWRPVRIANLLTGREMFRTILRGTLVFWLTIHRWILICWKVNQSLQMYENNTWKLTIVAETPQRISSPHVTSGTSFKSRWEQRQPRNFWVEQTALTDALVCRAVVVRVGVLCAVGVVGILVVDVVVAGRIGLVTSDIVECAFAGFGVEGTLEERHACSLVAWGVRVKCVSWGTVERKILPVRRR